MYTYMTKVTHNITMNPKPFETVPDLNARFSILKSVLQSLHLSHLHFTRRSFIRLPSFVTNGSIGYKGPDLWTCFCSIYQNISNLSIKYLHLHKLNIGIGRTL